VFPVRYGLNYYILVRRNSVFKGLKLRDIFQGYISQLSTLQAGRSRVRFSIRSLDFSLDLILPAALWPWGRLGL
jgi:hypothetical protein